MVGRKILRILGTWLLGFLLFSLCVGIFLLLLVCRHSLPPESVAIVREVWAREGVLFGPTALPFRIRVVQNTGTTPMRFLIQPPPFGVIEGIFSLQEEFPLSFRVPLWRKDMITGNPHDGSIACIGEVQASFQIAHHERFAKGLDPLLARYASPGQISPLLASLEEVGRTLPSNRWDLFREVLRLDFGQRVIGELGRISQSLHFKLYFAQKVLEEVPLSSTSERKITIWKYLEKYPWYKLEPQEMGKIVAEDTQTFEKIMTYLRKEDQQDEEFQKLKEEIQQYFSDYIANHPQSYSQELWEYAVERALEDYPLRLTPESIRSLTYRYLHEHLALLENLFQNEEYRKTLLTQYGVEIKNLSIQMAEDLASQYPELLR